MGYSGRLFEATVRIEENGTATLTASVMLSDDVLGPLTGRAIVQDDPAIVGAVLGFIVQMLPSLEAKAGFPVTMPTPVLVDGAIPSGVGDPEIIR